MLLILQLLILTAQLPPFLAGYSLGVKVKCPDLDAFASSQRNANKEGGMTIKCTNSWKGKAISHWSTARYIDGIMGTLFGANHCLTRLFFSRRWKKNEDTMKLLLLYTQSYLL